MSRTRTAVTVGALMLMAACASAPPRIDVRAEEGAIRALSAAGLANVKSRNAAAAAAMYTRNAFMQEPHRPGITGTDAIRRNWEESFALPNFQLTWEPTRITVAQSGDIAYEEGSFRVSFNSPDGPVSDEGVYVNMWRKTVDAGWKIEREVITSSKPEAPTPAPMIVMVESDQPGMHAAAGLTWGDLTRPGLKSGAKISVVHGDPASTGDYTIRLRFPDGFEIPPHWHPNGEHVTVLQGTFMFGMGTKFDRATLRTYGPGDFVYAPAKSPHFAAARGETIVQLHGQGPFQMNLVGQTP